MVFSLIKKRRRNPNFSRALLHAVKKTVLYRFEELFVNYVIFKRGWGKAK